MSDNPFKFLESIPSSEVAEHLAGEMGFVAGAALSQLSPAVAAKIIASMPDNRRSEIAAAMSKARQMPQEVLYEVAEGLSQKIGVGGGSTINPAPSVDQKNTPLTKSSGDLASAISNLKKSAASKALQAQAEASHTAITDTRTTKPELHNTASRREDAMQEVLKKAKDKKISPAVKSAPKDNTTSNTKKIDGMALAAHILREADPAVRDNIMHEMPALYNELHEQMFDFADLERSDSVTIGKVFSGVAVETAALALRFASDELQARVMKTISKRKAQMLQEEVSATSGKKTSLSEIERAQQAVIDYAVKLQNHGEIIIDPNDPTLV